MANKIKVTPEKLKQTASDFNQISLDIKRTTSQMMSLVTGISHSVWSGEAGSQFISRFRGLENDTEKMRKLVSTQVSHLNTIAQQYASTESEARQAAAALKNNVIA